MTERGRILAIDPGERRFGFAVSDPLGVTAQGLDTFTAGGADDVIAHVRRLVSAYTVGRIVLGLPLSMAGAEIEGTARARELAGRLEEACGVPVLLRDERMTSREAERIIGGGGGSSGRRPDGSDRVPGRAGGGRSTGRLPRGRRKTGDRRATGEIDRLAAVLLLQSYLDEQEGSC
jgi:putative Holliday junction resolvase